jgi:hypothetical protein
MVTVFSRGPRTDQGGYRQREPRFEYVNRSARPEAQAIRHRITRWLGAYPPNHRSEWIARFSSGDDVAYSSAFFELYLFTYFSRAGFSVEVAPGSKGGTVKAPDFKVTGKNGAFYLEATTAHDDDATERRANTWKTLVRARIDAIASDYFFVSLEWQRGPNVHPAPAQAARAVERWLPTLNYEHIRGRYRRSGQFTFPTLTLLVGGGEVKVLAIPKNNPHPTRGLLGAEGSGLRQVNVLSAVREALRKKSNRYGPLQLPYVVAINVQALTGEDDDFVDALLGTREVVVHMDGSHRWGYGNDGGFGNLGRPRAQGVSVVLCVRDISPWTIGQENGRRQMYLIHHPHARSPLPLGTIKLAERWVENGELRQSDGHDVRRILRIPKDWPEESH